MEIVELAIWATIKSERWHKPYTGTFDTQMKVVGVINCYGNIVDELNSLKRFRRSIIKAAVQAIREFKDPNRSQPPYVFIKLTAEADDHPDPIHSFGLRLEADDDSLWWLYIDYEDESCRRILCGDGLREGLGWCRRFLDEYTAKWAAEVSFQAKNGQDSIELPGA